MQILGSHSQPLLQCAVLCCAVVVVVRKITYVVGVLARIVSQSDTGSCHRIITVILPIRFWSPASYPALRFQPLVPVSVFAALGVLVGLEGSLGTSDTR